MMEINQMNENNTPNDFLKIKQRELNTNCQYNIPQVNIDKSKLNSNYTHEQLYPQIPLGILNSKFYLIKKLGSGSSGVVFLSYSIEDSNKTLYAIKLIPQTNSNFVPCLGFVPFFGFNSSSFGYFFFFFLCIFLLGFLL